MNLDQLAAFCVDQRKVYVGGRMGSGKTLLASLIAQHLRLRGGYRLLANYPLAHNTSLTRYDVERGNLEHTVLVLDEFGARYASNRDYNTRLSRELNQVVAYSRRLDQVYLFPTERNIDARLQNAYITRQEAIPHNKYLWVYKVFAGEDLAGLFWLWFPLRFVSLYRTTGVPTSRDDALVVALLQIMERNSADLEKSKSILERELLRSGEFVLPTV